jgi:hypothetical protein
MKKSSTGGLDATSPSSYFNIWVVGDMGEFLVMLHSQNLLDFGMMVL